MATIEFHGLSVREAEEVLAEICNFLEEYDIPSPQMVFKFPGWSTVTLGCRFAEPRWARLMTARMAGWIAESESRKGAFGRCGTIGDLVVLSERPPRRRFHLAAATLPAAGDPGAGDVVPLPHLSPDGISRRRTAARRRPS